jgi:hypothetical protein
VDAKWTVNMAWTESIRLWTEPSRKARLAAEIVAECGPRFIHHEPSACGRKSLRPRLFDSGSVRYWSKRRVRSFASSLTKEPQSLGRRIFYFGDFRERDDSILRCNVSDGHASMAEDIEHGGRLEAEGSCLHALALRDATIPD